jgi:hypothetical protein
MTTPESSVADFADLSAALTGYSTAELYGTGVIDLYYNKILDIVGERIFGTLLITWREKVRSTTRDSHARDGAIDEEILSDAMLGPVARNIIMMWYVGNWKQMPGAWRQTYGASAQDVTHVISAKAYREGLVWQAIDAHPPTAKQPGFGSWTAPPPGADEIDDEWRRTS